MREMATKLQGVKVQEQIGGSIKISALGPRFGQWDPLDSRINWMSWGLPIEQDDLPEGYDGGRWKLHTDKLDYNL